MSISTSHSEKMTTGDSNITYVDGTSLELNSIFWELEEEAHAYGSDTVGK